MDNIKLNYGESTVEFSIDGAREIKYLQGNDIPRIDNIKEAFIKSVTSECVDSPPLKDLIEKEDKLTIIISDLTRFWMRQDLICKELVDYLHEQLGVPYDNIVVLIALGTHRPAGEEELKKLASKEVFEKVQVLNHDALAEDLKYVGTTSRKTEVYVNSLVIGRKVIIISGTVHHVMAGFGGGRKSILPGVAGQLTIDQNHILSLDPIEPKSNQLIGLGKLEGNPVNEDMIEAASFVSPLFCINVVANAESQPCKLISGHWLKSWEESTYKVNEYFGVPIEKKADVVIASCGGFPKDLNLYQSVKTLFNASQALKDGGDLILLAECREGGGAPDFFDWIKSLKTNSLDADLRANFTIAGYIFYATCENINRGKAWLLSSIAKEKVEDMNLYAYTNINQLMKEMDLVNKDVYIMPYGGSTVPLIKKRKTDHL